MTMRPITETLLYDDAMRLVMSEARPISRTERVALADADGRVVARRTAASEPGSMKMTHPNATPAVARESIAADPTSW